MSMECSPMHNNKAFLSMFERLLRLVPESQRESDYRINGYLSRLKKHPIMMGQRRCRGYAHIPMRGMIGVLPGQPNGTPYCPASETFPLTKSQLDMLKGSHSQRLKIHRTLVVHFDGLASTVDPIAGDLTYTWSFGDGSFSPGIGSSHSYEVPSIYLATLTVVDELGQSDQDFAEKTVEEPPPA